MNVKEKVIEILNGINPYVDIDDNTDLLEELLDSMTILLLISEIEEEYGFEIDLSAFEVEWFQRIAGIVDFIERRQQKV